MSKLITLQSIFFILNLCGTRKFKKKIMKDKQNLTAQYPNVLHLYCMTSFDFRMQKEIKFILYFENIYNNYFIKLNSL